MLPPFQMSTSTIKNHISKGFMVAWMNFVHLGRFPAFSNDWVRSGDYCTVALTINFWWLLFHSTEYPDPKLLSDSLLIATRQFITSFYLLTRKRVLWLFFYKFIMVGMFHLYDRYASLNFHCVKTSYKEIIHCVSAEVS